MASVSRSGELHSSNHVARIENFRNIRTFDGNAYTIPGTILLSTKVWKVIVKWTQRIELAESYFCLFGFFVVRDLECKHLLTADFQQGKFAVVLSVNEITLLTVTQSVTVDAQGRLFLGDCDTPV